MSLLKIRNSNGEFESVPVIDIDAGILADLQNKKADKVDVPFRFGVDENGNYGYYKDGADTLTPFNGNQNTYIDDTHIEFVEGLWFYDLDVCEPSIYVGIDNCEEAFCVYANNIFDNIFISEPDVIFTQYNVLEE